MSAFTKATKTQARLRLALEGPAGYGKTYSALTLARELVGAKGKIAVVDTEAGSAAKYADVFDFDTIALDPPFHPERFVALIQDAEEAGYDLVLLDSLSHAWNGRGGLLEIVDEVSRTKYRGDSHRAWKDAGEIQQQLVDAILRARVHVIACMRTKTDYVRDEVEQDGRKRTVIRKAGVKVVQRDEFDYEFDIVGRFEQPAILTITKSRCSELPPAATAIDATDRRSIIEKPGAQLAETIKTWLTGTQVEAPRANGVERKKLDELLAQLTVADPERNWDEVAEKYAKREFGHGLGALTKPEMKQAASQFSEHLTKLTENGAAENDEVARDAQGALA